MNNLSHNIEALTIKELELLQEDLREKLRQIQKQIDLEQQSDSRINEAVTAIKRCKEWIDQFRPTARQKFQEAVFNCFDEYLATPLGAWSAAQENQVEPTSASDKFEKDTPAHIEETVAPNQSNTIENDDDPTSEDGTDDEAFDEYIDNPAEPEINLDKVEVQKDGNNPPTTTLSDTYAEFVNLTPKVGYLRRTDDGAILGAYLGGKNKSLLEVWARCISTEVAENTGRCEYEVRLAQRLKNIKYEIKFRHISFSVLDSLTQVDTSKSPKFRATEKGIQDLEKRGKSPAPHPPQDEPQAAASATEPLVLRVGDRVLIKSDRHGQEYVNQVGIVSAATTVGAAINVGGALRYFHVDEVNMVERSPEDRNPANDLGISVSAPLDLTDDAVPW